MTDINHQEKRECAGAIRALPLLFSALLFAAPSVAREPVTIPHVSAKAKQSYADGYRYANPHKAFAVAPGGGWSWRSDEASSEAAAAAAVAACGEHTAQRCVPFDVDGQVVFDRDAWPTLWRPYASAEEAAARAVGTDRGERFPDLAFRDADGGGHTLAEFRGKVVLLHFWGSWCPPCMREFPTLQRLQERLDESFEGEVVMVLLQVREPFADSKRWAEKNRFEWLPLYDSGAEEGTLKLADGREVVDRSLSPYFPSSYILDRHGLILQRHKGPVEDWEEYLPFLRDAVDQGRE